MINFRLIIKKKHQSLLARCGKVGVVRAAGILDTHQDAVVTAATFAEVVGLEVVRLFGPAVLV